MSSSGLTSSCFMMSIRSVLETIPFEVFKLKFRPYKLFRQTLFIALVLKIYNRVNQGNVGFLNRIIRACLKNATMGYNLDDSHMTVILSKTTSN